VLTDSWIVGVERVEDSALRHLVVLARERVQGEESHASISPLQVEAE
jgi:hypothetical protein